LKEALRVAKALGIKDAGGFPEVAEKPRASLTVNTAEVPLYMRGADALETEIAVLESRKSEEPFIAGFRDLQERLTYLEALSINADSLSAVTIDEIAKTPYKAEKPRKALILILALVFGAIGGFVLALVAELFSKMRETPSSS
jgi:chain length determinant protein (polysaccharide antigen chain regulator)